MVRIMVHAVSGTASLLAQLEHTIYIYRDGACARAGRVCVLCVCVWMGQHMAHGWSGLALRDTDTGSAVPCPAQGRRGLPGEGCGVAVQFQLPVARICGAQLLG